MALKWPVVGIGHAPAYQVAGVPWVTSSISTPSSSSAGSELVAGWDKYTFDNVTKYIRVHNDETSGTGTKLAVGFTEYGLVTGSNYFTVNDAETVLLDVRTTQIFISTSIGPAVDTGIAFDLIAGLTSIPTSQMPILTASNGFDGVG